MPEVARWGGNDEVVVPPDVLSLADGEALSLVWQNQTGGLTFRVGQRFIKWNPNGSGVSLAREQRRLEWLAGRHPVPVVLESGIAEAGEWLVTEAMTGESAVHPNWLAQSAVAVAAIATGLRALHAVDAAGFPSEWSETSWVTREPEALGERPPLLDPVLVSGDACAPNTLLSADGRWVGNVDMGDVAVGDRWADLAVATMSLGWNYGDGLDRLFYQAYGIDPDPERIDYYRALYRLES